MKDGVFTTRIYDASGVILNPTDREGLIIGLPLRHIEKEKIGSLTSLQNQTGSGSYALEVLNTNETLKADVNDKIFDYSDIKLYLSEDYHQIPLTATEINKANYNLTTEAQVISLIGVDFYAPVASYATVTGIDIQNIISNLAYTINVGNKTITFTVTSADQSAAANMFYSLVEKGSFFGTSKVLGQTVVTIDKSTNTITFDAATNIPDDDENWILYKSYDPTRDYFFIAGHDTLAITITNDAGVVTIGGDDADSFMGSVKIGSFFGSSDSVGNRIIAINKTLNTITLSGTTDVPGVDTWKLYDEMWVGGATPLYITMSSQKSGLSGTKTITGIDEWSSYFGKASSAHPEDNLGYASLNFLYNSPNAFKIHFIPVDGTSSIASLLSNSALWLSEYDKTINFEEPYFVVACSDSQSVNQVIQTRIDAMSLSSGRRERRMYISRCILNLGKGYKNPYTKGDMYLDTNYNHSDDVNIAKDIPAIYQDSRVVLCGPYYAHDGTYLIESYNIAILFAAAECSASLGESLTFSTIPGFNMLPATNYFSDADYEVLKNNGWNLVTQSTVSAPVKGFHQTTTDVSSLELKEGSLVIIVDALSKDIRKTLDNYIANGTANRIAKGSPTDPVSVKYIKKLNDALSSLRTYYTTTIKALAGFKITQISINETNSDQVDFHVEINHLYPVNRINSYIHIV